MKRRHLLALLLCLGSVASCQTEKTMSEVDKQPASAPKVPEGAETITVAGGCFWCIEGAYRRIDGIISATSGYMGGTKADPTYEEVCTGATGHAEAVQLVYDPKKITTEKVLAWFWDLHDPTTLNRQGADVGTQYRSVIFYHTEEQKKIAEASKKAAQANYDSPIVTEITKEATFYPAENYHQDYYTLNKSKNGYCRVVIEPKLKKLHLDK